MALISGFLLINEPIYFLLNMTACYCDMKIGFIHCGLLRSLRNLALRSTLASAIDMPYFRLFDEMTLETPPTDVWRK